MKDQIIVFELPGGDIRHATCPEKGKRPGETTGEWLLRAFDKTVRDNPNFSGAKRILNPVMPDGQPFTPGAKKLYYHAWLHTGSGAITIDMPAARDIRMAEIRIERNQRLNDSDREWARLYEIGTPEQQDAHRAYRQALRDVPQSIDLNKIDTAVKLDAFQPDWPGQP